MNRLLVFAFLIVAGQCREISKRDVSEIAYGTPNIETRPIYRPQETPQVGYDYPKPVSVQPRPIYRDPEPVYIQPRPIYRDPEPNWVQTRPNVITRPIYQPAPTIIQTRPINNGYYPTQTSEKLFWPLINKISSIFSGQGGYNPGSSGGWYPGGNQGGYPGGFPGGSNGWYPGSNTIGYPSGGNYPGIYPGNYPSKLSVLNHLLPSSSEGNYQRVEIPAPVTTYQPGVSAIGDTVTVEASPTDEGYSYPNPNVQQPPLNLPGGLQFKAEPNYETDTNANNNN